MDNLEASLFPQEIWTMIFHKIEQSEDFENIANASLYFRTLLFEKRIFFLFPKVFEILNLPKASTEIEDLRVCRPTSRHLTYKDKASSFLSCRRACKSWCTTIDNFYQQHPSHYKTSCYHNCREFCQYSGNTHVKFPIPSPYSGTQRIDDFLDHFCLSHCNSVDPLSISSKNPFIARSISFVDIYEWRNGPSDPCQNMTNVARFWFGIDRLLSRYGHHVWYCDILLDNKMDCMYQKNLSGWLKYMPNLKVLNIWYGDGQQPEKYQKELFRQCPKIYIVNPKDNIRWEKEIDQFHVGIMEHLKLIRVQGLPAPVFNEIIQKNDHVSELIVDSLRQESRWINRGYNIFSGSLPNLKSLSWRVYSHDEIKQLDVGGEKWNLHTLDIDLLGEVSGSLMNWRRLFGLLSKNWSSTLTHLTLRLHAAGTESDQISRIKRFQSLTLSNLPNIRHLKLMLQEWLPIDFILPLQSSLEHLDIVVRKYDKDLNSFLNRDLGAIEDVEKVQFVKCREGKYLESNIWSMFENLKSLRVQVETGWKDGQFYAKSRNYPNKEYFYTRAQWNQWKVSTFVEKID